MKIISWNVNGIRAVERKKALQELLKDQSPDILLLQEIKGTIDKFSKYLTDNPDYETFYNSAEKPGYAGTSIWVKRNLNISNITFETSFPNNPNGDEGRISHIDFEKAGKPYSIFGVYFPNGGKSQEAFDLKLIFYDRFLEHMNTLREQGRTVIWGGDVNCAHNEIDLTRAKENQNNIGFLPVERAWLDKVHNEGWYDVFRKTYPDKIIYSWWDVITRARERNVGWRIDYFFVDEKYFPEVKNIEYLNDQMGSDHCPVMLEI